MRVLWCLVLLLLGGSVGASQIEVRFSPGQSHDDKRYTYYWELLEAALSATRASDGDFRMTPVGETMSPARATAEVASDGLINVIVRTADARLDKTLRPLRIPLDKGLTGYRLFLVNHDDQPDMDRVDSLADLRRHELGQGRGWVDVEILRSAGFNVVEGEGYDSLFMMLVARRFKLFPRGINEIQGELEAQRERCPSLAIERHLILYYPLPRYFYFARTEAGERLARRVEDGLQRLIRSGDFERRYRAYKKRVLGNLPLSGRRVFRIANPDLPPETPLNHAAYWDDLATELR
ncbi:hypothetical protein GCM10025771_01330 [Niveibacterium umoris]|uniref:Solute-binding protein family 3/N-terminal domain-containing protein n=1 Tax=Niveibacterium umoris TaxID=1193620 RepID=A0A840BP05_9RHOO|nr:hypothetical protein [Niveibacterium umoris]MBB4014324.1 hypothetical protein [Niveibacterium umoris]